MLTLTKFFHGAFRQISAIVSYNAMWKAKAKYHLFDELNRRGRITLTDWFCLYPLGKLINRHQQVGLLVLGPLKGSNHIQPQVIGIILNS